MRDDIIITPSEELKGLLAMMASQQVIKSEKEIIFNDDAAGYVRLRDYLDIMGVGGKIRDIILTQKADAGLSRAVAHQDLLLKLNMVNKHATQIEYVEIDPQKADDVDDDVGDAENM